jgi:hypothetical protein
MRLVSPLVGSLIVILLVAIPVGGTPALQTGSYATYALKAQISFAPPICGATPTSGTQSSVIVCPMTLALPIDTNITGTLGWRASSLSSTTAVLNVTKDVTVSNDGLMIPDRHITSSFNESVDLATRIISIMPFLRTEMDDALQMDQATTSALPTAIGPNTAMSTVESTMIQPRSVYTMWWMNETLHQGQNVPILVFPTSVVGAGTFDFQGKTRSTWNLLFNRTWPAPQPETGSMSPTWTGNGLGTVFRFEYDQTSGLLLSATADINIGFIETTVMAGLCDPVLVSPSTSCTSTITPIFLRSGFSIHASLTLTGTNLNLDSTLSSPVSGQTGGTTGSGGSSGSGSGGNTGGSTGSGSGGSGSTGGSSGGTSGGSTGGSGSSGGTNGGSSPGTGSGSNSGGTPAPSSAKPTVGIAPWIYLLLAAVIVAIVASALWIARRQSKKRSSQPNTLQPS